jgi:hypothetical protein
MATIVLRIRPTDSMDDLDLSAIRDRMRPLTDLSPELDDARLSDAPYVSLTLDLPVTDARMVRRLQDALSGLEGIVVQVWNGQPQPLRLMDVDAETLANAAQALAHRLGQR